MAFSLPEKRRHIRDIFINAVSAVEPDAAVRRVLARDGDTLYVGREQAAYHLNDYDHVLVVGCGKAGSPMAAAVEEILGDRLTGGLVVVKYGCRARTRRGAIEIIEAGHPEPDTAGMDGCGKTIALLRDASERDLVIAPVSGGGSALWTLPPPSISLDDKIALSRMLLGCGADIRQVNAVRKHVSAIKGGRAALVAAPAQVVVLVVSDVVGDHLDVIASGPFAPDSTTFRDAWDVIDEYDLQAALPKSVREHLARGLEGRVPETPKASASCFNRVRHVLCATNALALRAAADRARALGYRVETDDNPLCGEARVAGQKVAAEAIKRSGSGAGPPRCLVFGGETTVTLGNRHGRGGRNQELTLSAAHALDGREDILLASIGTDGTDGPTDAAGAVADGTTLARALNAGLDAGAALAYHDAYPFFDRLGDLVKTGPTNTNVMDIQIVLIG